MSDFLLEIGTEEIPASYLSPAAQALAGLLVKWFDNSGIRVGGHELFYTPRRLAVLFTEVARSQELQVKEVQGPPRRAAFDDQGQPTKVGLGFARAHGKTVAELLTKTTPKGEYVYVSLVTSGRDTAELLADALPSIIAQVPFRKTMRWCDDRFRFARPIRWLVALLDQDVIQCSVAGVRSGRTSYGLRQAGPPVPELERPSGPGVNALKIELRLPGEYAAALRRAGVMPDPAERRQAIASQTEQLLQAHQAEIVRDEELLDEITNVVESPQVLIGHFSGEYLSLPSAVVIMTLKQHMRCLAVRRKTNGGGGELLPLFAAVLNTPTVEPDEVRKWYERSAESRLRDASFYVQEDLRVGLARYAQAEHEVTWMNELGTLHDKTERLVALSELLAKMVTALPCHKAVDLAALRRAATLAKADLLSKVVREKEYTSLQGIIGGVYALAAGESQVAAKAIEEHYLPRNLGDPLPSTSEGRILSFVDKLDNACAAFAIGAGPTGSEDPYAVRRQVTALLNLVLDSGWRVNLRELIDANLGMMPDSRPELRTQISQFVKDRLGLLLGDKGMAYDIVNAVIDLAWSDPQDALVRGQALADARQKSDFERLVIGQKRVANILKAGSQGQARDTVSSETGAATRAGESVSCQESCVLQPGLLVESAEQMLYQGAQALAEPLAQSCGAQDYRQAMELLLTLRPLIDEFFDQVLVMCPDQRLSANRLALLRFVSSLFGQVADLSQIVI